MRIDNFKKEFRVRLSAILNKETEINPKEEVLDFNNTAIIVHDMGFLQSKVSEEQEELMDDIYTVFKC
jgi:rhamnose utilization protein RhaD (predicted bifunctional aldolase and dehydrogenase)